jgi:hypothetical protein
VVHTLSHYLSFVGPRILAATSRGCCLQDLPLGETKISDVDHGPTLLYIMADGTRPLEHPVEWYRAGHKDTLSSSPTKFTLDQSSLALLRIELKRSGSIKYDRLWLERVNKIHLRNNDYDNERVYFDRYLRICRCLCYHNCYTLG